MTKQSIGSPQLNSSDFSEGWMDHPFVEWLSAYKQYLIGGCVGLFALLVLAYRLLSTQTLQAEKDFFQAQADFLQFQQNQDPSANPTLLKELKDIMARHPELHAKYDGALAQTLLIEGNPSEAKPFAQSSFQRTRPDRLEFYQDYAKTSLLIGEGLYSDALAQAKQLKDKMDQQTDSEAFGQTLYTFNLIRLAMLYQQLNQSQQESEAWAALQNQAEKHLVDVLPVYQLFKTGQTSLNHYIDERKQALSP
ncbi:hypothetical protein [Candidatus Protochlamydia phocaeensis]|uniref:hypothetical protein n=1 Tax=Candidatus Protochlamydia phocaeensis TaxID=1414722 RepID=UPI0012AB92A5|nr:hypothetical protein [Candidatus Protochlamydia phocaeensis]